MHGHLCSTKRLLSHRAVLWWVNTLQGAGGACSNSQAVPGSPHNAEQVTPSHLHLQGSLSPKLGLYCLIRLRGLCSWACLLLYLSHAKV